MKTVKDVMTSDVVWVSPSARVKTAVILMKGHEIGALPVVHSDESVVGLLTYQGVLGQPPEAAVSQVMQPDFASVEPGTEVREAAEVMGRSRASHLVVLEAGKLAGILSHSDLIGEFGRNFDPLTELPWSDALREWAMDALKRGDEISVIFFDLDELRSFNKKHGHVVGDTVIKEVASVIKAGIDPDLELACRYGGDEFAIVSVRHADEALKLADLLQESIARIGIEGVADQVSGTYGMYGGRRTKEREDIHYAATIDDLITRASKECLARKVAAAAPAPAEEPTLARELVERPGVPAAAGPRLKIRTIDISTSGTEAKVGVTLAIGARRFHREVSGYVVGGANLLRMVAEATAGAAAKSLAPGHGIVVDEVTLHDSGREEPMVTVESVFLARTWSVRHVGSAVVRRGDVHRAAAAALLASVNRLIETVPRAEEEPPESPADPETATQQ